MISIFYSLLFAPQLASALETAKNLKRIYIVRHGESTWTHKMHMLPIPHATKAETDDKTFEGEDTSGFRDAPLTDNGKAMASLLGQIMSKPGILENSEAPLMDKVDLIVTSPLSRTLMTASLIKQHSGSNVSVIANPLCREFPSTPQDVGTDVEFLRKNFPLVDFSNVPAGNWWHGDHSDRVAQFRKWLMERPEQNIMVVTHREYMRKFIDAGFGFRFTECGVMERWLSGTPDASRVDIPNKAYVPLLWKGGPVRIAHNNNAQKKTNLAIDVILSKELEKAQKEYKNGRQWNSKKHLR